MKSLLNAKSTYNSIMNHDCEKGPTWGEQCVVLYLEDSKSQYLVCHPCLRITDWHRRGTLWIKFRITALGTARHSSWRAMNKASSVCGWTSLPLTRRPMTSQRCSIGLRSGLLAGQGSTVTLWCWRNSIETRAVCGRALSCWNSKFRPTRRWKGTTIGLNTSSR